MQKNRFFQICDCERPLKVKDHGRWANDLSITTHYHESLLFRYRFAYWYTRCFVSAIITLPASRVLESN